MPKKRPQEVTLILGKLKRHFGKTLENASMEHIYQACAFCVRDEIMDRWINARNKVDKQGKKMVLYMSAEFLIEIGRAHV